MTGTSARTDASHVDRTMDRRQLLRAGAWAAPVIVLAAAVPAAAASGDGEVTPVDGHSGPTVSRPVGDILKVKEATAASGWSLGALNYRMQEFYSYDSWGLTGQNNQTDGPQSISFTYTVTLTHTASGAVVTPEKDVLVVLAKNGTHDPGWKTVENLAAGEWKADFSFGAVVPIPEIVNGTRFVLTGALPPRSSTAVVKTSW